MHESYELYCLADRRFYDTPANRGARASGLRDHARGRCRAGGSTCRASSGCTTRPTASELPASRAGRSTSRPDSRTPSGRSTAVWEYCVPRGIAFKFLRNEAVLVMVELEVRPPRVERQAGDDLPDRRRAARARPQGARRNSSGASEGPYILSDLRYAEGPLFVRYGAFVSRLLPVTDRGERVLRARGRPGPIWSRTTAARPSSMPPWVAAAGLPASRISTRATRSPPTTSRTRSTASSSSPTAAACTSATTTRPATSVVLKEGRPHAGSRHGRAGRGRPDRPRARHPAAAGRPGRRTEGARLLRSLATTTSWCRSSSTRTRCSASWSGATR